MAAVNFVWAPSKTRTAATPRTPSRRHGAATLPYALAPDGRPQRDRLGSAGPAIDLVLRLSAPVHDCRYERFDFRRRDVQARKTGTIGASDIVALHERNLIAGERRAGEELGR
jgi:hypothetical protein